MKAKEYIMHLMAELSNYVLDSHPDRMVISLHQESDGLHLCVIDTTERTDEELDTMRAALRSNDRPELAEYYGSMGGSDLLGEARLDLVGWQVKYSEISRTEKGTKIDLWLGGDGFESEKFTIPKDKI